MFRRSHTASGSRSSVAKRAAARAAVQGSLSLATHRTIGIGSGSTVVYVVEEMARKLAEVRKSTGQVTEDFRFVSTGWQSRAVCLEYGLPLVDVRDVKEIDIAFDGADDVDANLNVIKGGGACHLQEKIVMEKSKHNVLVADWRKDSKVLCHGEWNQGIPLEVVSPALDLVLARLSQLSSAQNSVASSTRQGGSAKAGPVVTDNGNLIVDVQGLSRDVLRTPAELARQLKLMTGVVEVGLFTDMVQEAYFGQADGSVVRRIRSGS